MPYLHKPFVPFKKLKKLLRVLKRDASRASFPTTTCSGIYQAGLVRGSEPEGRAGSNVIRGQSGRIVSTLTG
jgi:hypothetical protein